MISEPNEVNISGALPAERSALPTQQEIDHYVARGRRLQSRMVVLGMTRFWRWIKRPFPAASPSDQIEPIANALAAIRSAVEILRDTPDLDARERRRFAEIILREESRLEALLDTWRGRSGQSA